MPKNDFDNKFTIRSTLEAIDWFKETVHNLESYKKSSLAKEYREKKKEITEITDTNDRFEVGKMYLFHYNPKGVKTLPYYDTFPLIILMGMERGHFYGINFHYLPVEVRMILLSNLLTKSVFKGGELERLRVSYDIVKNVTTMKAFKPCFKQYLMSHVKGSIKLIQPSDWGFAAALPIEVFKSNTRFFSKYVIWRESMDSLD